MSRPFFILVIIVTLLYTATAIELSGGWLNEYAEPKGFNEFDVDQHIHDVIANNAERMLRRPVKTCRDGKRCKKKSDCKK